MKKFFVTALLSAYVLPALPAWVGGADLGEVMVDPSGVVSVGSFAQPPGTCSLWNIYFTFNSSSQGGKNMLALLLTAKAAGKKVNIWYSESSMPGTSQSNGCSASTISTLQGISIP